MTSLQRRPRLLLALAAAALTALALAFVPGAMAGKGADPKAPPAPSAADTLLYRGATTVSVDPTAAGALESLGIAVTPVHPARATGKADVRFPITFGVVDAATLAGQIRHSGGLKAVQGDTTVYLTRYFIDIDDTPTLSGLVGAGPNEGDRVELFDLDLSGLQVTPGKKRITLSGIGLTLTDDAAAALNGAFGGGAEPFAEGLPIGTATVTARTATKG